MYSIVLDGLVLAIAGAGTNILPASAAQASTPKIAAFLNLVLLVIDRSTLGRGLIISCHGLISGQYTVGPPLFIRV